MGPTSHVPQNLLIQVFPPSLSSKLVDIDFIACLIDGDRPLIPIGFTVNFVCLLVPLTARALPAFFLYVDISFFPADSAATKVYSSKVSAILPSKIQSVPPGMYLNEQRIITISLK